MIAGQRTWQQHLARRGVVLLALACGELPGQSFTPWRLLANLFSGVRGGHDRDAGVDLLPLRQFKERVALPTDAHEFYGIAGRFQRGAGIGFAGGALVRSLPFPARNA
jgi:hypothetical protein